MEENISQKNGFAGYSIVEYTRLVWIFPLF